MSAVTEVDPLAVRCPYCRMAPGRECQTASMRPGRPHKARVKLATVLAGHADPSLDEWFPRLGPCGLCGTPGLDQRHRVIDAIAGQLGAGEDPEVVAVEMDRTGEAVAAVAAWAQRWPGAWQ